MTLMLASVSGPEEAEIAIAHGADIIDLRNAARADFAAAPRDIVRATVAAVQGRRPVSAVTGQVPMRTGSTKSCTNTRSVPSSLRGSAG